ncbi:MAG: endonuclease MutS2 [Clostridia bacterium]|nr:endonuclease MutS2 [Clostridia bacterium]
MIDFNKALNTLEFYKITDMLASLAPTKGAKAMAAALVPSADMVEVQKRLRETTDAKNMSASNGSPSFGGVVDVTPSAERAVKGAMLTTRELLDVADLLHVTSRLVAYAGEKSETAGSLGVIFSRLVPNSRVEGAIKRAIVSEDMIADDASPKLYEIRRSIKVANNKVREILQKYITGDAYSKILQDNIVTMRNGRYVIPVKAEHKGEIKGLVHDTSSSGATIFIEPIAVVEQNNALKELEIAEAKEIERILYELSDEVAEISEILTFNYLNITDLAFAFAKAELSWALKGICPNVTEGGETNLIGARHPLLNKNKVVPIDIRIGGEFDSLIITGPNTGGKTVTLKTLGLLTLMAQAGLHIPCRDGSSVRVFESVHADIGDEQSIEQSLSTFSAHMTNIVRILDSADDKSLVLFDELGAGTDPVEGAALAVAIIEKIRSYGALSAATTHYAEMKVYALETEGVCNAACEFDINTLAPTYRLIIGAPGKSNAFAISQRLGLSELVIKRAKALIDGDNKRFDNVLAKLEESRQAVERDRKEIEEIKREYASKLANAEREAAEKIAKAENALKVAQDKATSLLESARATSDYVLAELDKAKRARDTAGYAEELESARANIRRSMKETDDLVNPVQDKKDKNYVLPRPLRKGDEVIIMTVDRRGTLLSDADAKGNVSVKTGLITTKTNIKNLKLCEDSETVAKKNAAKNERRMQSVVQNFKTEIDLRGMNGEEGWTAVDRYLDNAILAGMHTVHLIHGKGTGALKRHLWEALRIDGRVASYRIGQWGEGDGGVTVVELK